MPQVERQSQDLQIHLSDGLRQEAMNVILCEVRDWKSCGEDWTLRVDEMTGDW